MQKDISRPQIGIKVQPRTFLIMTIGAIILTPSIGIGLLPAVRLEQVLLALALLYLSTRTSFRKDTLIQLSLFPFMLMGFSFFILLSLLGSYAQGIRIIPSDLFEIYKPLVYSGIFIIAATCAVEEENKVKALISIRNIIVVSALVAFIQFFNPFNINETYVPLIAPTQYRTLVDGYRNPRVVAMTGNPNIYAVIAATGVLISLALFLKTKKKQNLLFGILCFIALLMTSSRSGFAFLMVAVGTYYFQYFKGLIFSRGHISINGLKTAIITILYSCLILYIVVNLFPTNLTWRIIGEFNFSTAGWQARLIHWSENIHLFKLSPLIGVGPAKSIELQYAADNEWLLLLRRYGIIGTLYLVFTFVFPVFYYGKRLTRKLSFRIYVSTLAGIIVYMIPSIAFHSFQLMPLIMVLAGLAFSDMSRLKKSSLS